MGVTNHLLTGMILQVGTINCPDGVDLDEMVYFDHKTKP